MNLKNKNLLNNIKEYFISIFNKYKYLKGSFYVLIILFLIIYYPIIKANFDYADDIMRKINHNSSLWATCYGAYIAWLLEYILQCGTFTLDISPFSEIISILFLSLSGIILIDTFSSIKKFNIINIFSVLLIGLTPSFLECFSYKFDVAHFGMSVFFSVLPLVFYKEKKHIFIPLTSIFLLFSFMTYHAASGIYIVSIIFLLLSLYIKGSEIKDMVYLLLKSAISYIIAMGIFAFSLTFLQFSSNAIASIKNNINLKTITMALISIYKFLFRDIKENYCFIIFLFIIISIFIFSLYSNVKKQKIIVVLLSLISLMLAFILQFGASQLVIDQINYSERYYFGWGVTFSIMLLMSNAFLIKQRKILVFVILFVAQFIISTLRYGNGLNDSINYTKNRIYPIISNLNKYLRVSKNKQHTLNIAAKQGIYDFLILNYNTADDASFALVKPLFSPNESRLFNYYFPKNKLITLNIQMDEFSVPETPKYVNNMRLYNETRYYKFEIGVNNKIQIIIYEGGGYMNADQIEDNNFRE